MARKDFIAEEILKQNPKTVGLYRLVMKAGSDNVRASAVQGVTTRIKAKGVTVVVFEPSLAEDLVFNAKVIRGLAEFKAVSDVIVSNRMAVELDDVMDKVFTRDVFGDN